MSNTENPHRESVIDPSEYTHVGCFYQGASNEMYEAHEDEHAYLDEVMSSVGGMAGMVFHANGYGCAHCGSNFSYGSVFSHPVHGFLAIGHTCASNRLTFDSNVSLRASLAKTRGASARKNAQLAAKFEGSVSDELAEAFKVDHYIIRNIQSSGRQYGSISDKQEELVLKIAKEEINRPEKIVVPKCPVPMVDSRVSVEGVVISTKWVDNDYGSTFKMLVEVSTPEGSYRIFGTAPRGVEIERGATVKFDARLSVSKDDESFGFFSRPTKAVIVD